MHTPDEVARAETRAEGGQCRLASLHKIRHDEEEGEGHKYLYAILETGGAVNMDAPTRQGYGVPVSCFDKEVKHTWVDIVQDNAGRPRLCVCLCHFERHASEWEIHR